MNDCVCAWATEHTFWHRNIIFGISDRNFYFHLFYLHFFPVYNTSKYLLSSYWSQFLKLGMQYLPAHFEIVRMRLWNTTCLIVYDTLNWVRVFFLHIQILINVSMTPQNRCDFLAQTLNWHQAYKGESSISSCSTITWAMIASNARNSLCWFEYFAFQLECCGANGPEDWNKSNWKNGLDPLPQLSG